MLARARNILRARSRDGRPSSHDDRIRTSVRGRKPHRIRNIHGKASCVCRGACFGTPLGARCVFRSGSAAVQPGFERRYPYQKNSHVLARGPRGAIVRRSRVRPPKPCMTTPRHATPTTYTCTWPCTTLRPRPAVRAGLRTAALQKALSA